MFRCGGSSPASVLYFIEPDAEGYCPHSELCDCHCHCPCKCHEVPKRCGRGIEVGDKPLIECIREGYSVWWLKMAVSLGKWRELNLQESYTLDTPLHVACQPQYYDFSLVEHFLRHGADPNITNVKGEIALHIAAGSNNLPCARLLYSHGSRIDLLDSKDRLPEDRTRDKRSNGPTTDAPHRNVSLHHLLTSVSRI